MAGLRYSVGDRVLVSRDETGVDHEVADVVDSYELIIGPERKPMVVVQLADGERRYLAAKPPNVLPYEPEEEEAEGEGGEDGEPDAADGPNGPDGPDGEG